MTQLSKGLLIFVGSLALSGCDTFRNTFGLDHYTPDEWAAEPSAALILPPDLHARPKLPPPQPGAPNPHVVPHTVKAQQAVLGGSSPTQAPAPLPKGEKDVVEKASEHQEVTPNIREIVNKEAQEEGMVSEKVLSKIRSWKQEAAKNLRLSPSGPDKLEEKTASSQAPMTTLQEEEAE